jgi:hypothetical protein
MAESLNVFPSANVTEMTRQTSSLASTANPQSSRRSTQPQSPMTEWPICGTGKLTETPFSLHTRTRHRSTSTNQPSEWPHPQPSPWSCLHAVEL